MAELVYRVGLENRSSERDRGFESYSFRKIDHKRIDKQGTVCKWLTDGKTSFWPCRLSVRSPGFHPGKSGSTPGRATKINLGYRPIYNKKIICKY